jgi:anti-sigma factor RsiW
MSVTDDRLEILIGKSLDGELSPQERRLLESELEQNRYAKELFEQMRVLHECSCGVVTHEILGQGADPVEVFERAWQQNERSLWRRVITADGHLHWGSQTRRIGFGGGRFAVGLAAGFLLGLVLHFVLAQLSETPTNVPSESLVAREPSPAQDGRMVASPGIRRGAPREITREVDWYVFTDRTGNQWLIEGVREGMVRPAAYRGSL